MGQKYLGIFPYDENTSSKFAGRIEESWTLFDSIIRNDYTVYYAASGEGKSSVIRAGLLPILRRRDYFPVYITFQDNELCNTFSLKKIIYDRIKVSEKTEGVTFEQADWSIKLYEDKQEILDVLRNNFWWILRNYSLKRGEKELKPLFIFDQFEEIFTKAGYECTDSFFLQLEELTTDYVPQDLKDQIFSFGIDITANKNFKILFSLRTEYLGELDYWCEEKHFLPSLKENRLILKPLTPKNAKEIVNLDKSLQKYSDQIIRGCAEYKANIQNNDQPCVHALVLSVVCHTLCTLTDNERNIILDKLNKNRDDTIDDILLKFYKSKLKDAGLDYFKDERIIAQIENIFVDENGRRSRHDTDEPRMQPILKWINILCNKDNGLLKVIAKKEVNRTIVKTLELPHDRICKAIDSSRKERQGKLKWKLLRQGEWFQFGIISAVIIIIALLWNSLMPAIKPIIHWFIGTDYTEIFRSFPEIFSGNIPQLSEIFHSQGFVSLCLMVLMLLFFPLIVTFITRTTKRWQVTFFIITCLGVVLFGLLWYESHTINITDNYIIILIALGFFSNLICFVVSLVRLKISIAEPSKEKLTAHQSNWPLWGGYFLFACYLFYECLYSTTLGINEQSDSSWALFTLPILYLLWSSGFFCMKLNGIRIKFRWLSFLLIIIILLSLSIISYIPYNFPLKRSYGFSLSVILIILFSFSYYTIISRVKSNTKYYIISTGKRLLAGVLCIIIITTTFFLNLGYNPFVISPGSVCYVNTWRTAVIENLDSIGIVYPTNGRVILPCCIPLTEEMDSILTKGHFFKSGEVTIESDLKDDIFKNQFECRNSDSSLQWNSTSNILTAKILVVPTLEEHLHNILEKNISKKSSLKDSIDFFAAKLFMEIRNANIKYILNNNKYDLNTLTSLAVLDSLQQKSLDKELNVFQTTSAKGALNRSYFKVLEDEDLVNFYKELSRYYLLCLIKDRAAHLDMLSMFTLMKSYLIYFIDVPGMYVQWRFQSILNIGAINTETNIGNHWSTHDITINTDDLLNKRLFAWSEIFNNFCYMDLAMNIKRFEKSINNLNLIDISKLLDEFSSELKEIAQGAEAFDLLLNSKVSTKLLIERIKIYLNTSNPERYENILKHLNTIGALFSEINYIESDLSFKSLKDKIFFTILPQIKNNPSGIYNNDFENICKNLIIVSTSRGYEIKDDLDSLENYINNKNAIYNLTKLKNGIDGKLNSQKDKQIKMIDSLKPMLERVIHDLKNQ